MQYLQPFLYFAKKPKTGFNNLLFGCLGVLVPIAGEIALLGYRAELSEELERDPEMQNYPDINLDHLGRYFKKGLAPFFTRLMFVLIVIWPALGLAVGSGFGIHFLVPDVPILGIGVGYLVFFLTLMASLTFLWPMEYYAQVTGKFAPLRELGFAYHFLRLCGLSTFFSLMAYSFLSLVTCTIGYLLFCVGIYPAVVVMQMAEQHYMTQLYLLYLDEGGEPILRPSEDDDLVPRRGRILSEEDDD